MPGYPNSTSVTVTDVMATIDPAIGNVAKKYVWLVNIATGVKYGPSAATDSSGNWSLAAVDQGIYETFYAGESPVGVVPTQWTTAGVKGYLVSIASNPLYELSSSNRYNPKNPTYAGGAKGDGVTNDSAAIAAAQAKATADGGGVLQFGFGTFISNGNTAVPGSNTYWQGVGPGATILKGVTDTNVFAATGLSEVGIRDMQIQVVWSVGTPSGIQLTTCSKVTIENVEVVNAWDSIDCLAGCSDVLVFNCNIHGAQQQGIQVTGAAGRVRIIGNTVNGVGSTNLHHCCYVYGGTGSGTDVTITGNTFTAAYGFGIQAYDTQTLSPHGRLTITGNTCSGNGLGSGTCGGIYVGTTTSSVIVSDIAVGNNICVANGNGDGIIISSAVRFSVTGNICKGNQNGLTIQVSSGASIEGTVTGNDLSTNATTKAGLRLAGAAGTILGLLVLGNLMRDHNGGGGAGIFSTGVWDNVVIIGNDLRNNTNPVSLVGSNNRMRDNKGWQPYGAVTTPGFPASTGNAQNTLNVDIVAYITNGTNALTVLISGGGVQANTTLTVPANAMVPVLIPAGCSATMTYGAGAPTWIWFGA